MSDLFNETARILSEKIAARDETITALHSKVLADHNLRDDGIRLVVGSVCPKCHRVDMVPVDGHALTGEDDYDIETCDDCADCE